MFLVTEWNLHFRTPVFTFFEEGNTHARLILQFARFTSNHGGVTKG